MENKEIVQYKQIGESILITVDYAKKVILSVNEDCNIKIKKRCIEHEDDCSAITNLEKISSYTASIAAAPSVASAHGKENNSYLGTHVGNKDK